MFVVETTNNNNKVKSSRKSSNSQTLARPVIPAPIETIKAYYALNLCRVPKN